MFSPVRLLPLEFPRVFLVVAAVTQTDKVIVCQGEMGGFIQMLDVVHAGGSAISASGFTLLALVIVPV